MIDKKASTKKTPLSKGEKTRLKILEAALRVIADVGPQAITHRAVATEAKVSLSLTTYYFKDLSEMLVEAFRLHKSELHERVAPSLLSYHQEAEVIQACRAKGDVDGLNVAIDAIAGQLCDFMLGQLPERSQDLKIELAFYFDMHMPEHFRQLAYGLRQRFVDDATELATSIGSHDPETDAELIISTIQRLQYEAISVPEYMTESKFRRQIRHLLRSLWRV